MDRFSGVLVPALTPFDRDLAPDAARLGRYCRWLLDRGANGLAVFGTTSEANSLSLAERKSLLELVIESGVPAKVLLPGTGTCSLPESVELTRHAVGLGCGGVLMLPPFYYKGVGTDGLFASFAEVIERVGEADLRIYLYHFPAMSGVPVTADLVERLIAAFHATHERIYTIKDETDTVEFTTWRVQAIGRNALHQRLAARPMQDHAGPLQPKSRRPVYLHERGGMTELAVFDADEIAAGARIEGPALVEAQTFTTLLLPEQVAEVDADGNYLVAI